MTSIITARPQLPPPRLGDIDLWSLRTEHKRDTVRELHGYRGAHGPWRNGADHPAWPEPYQLSYGSEAFVAELDRPVRHRATQKWEHGFLRRVRDETELERVTARWGERRTRDAAVGPFTVPGVAAADRELVRAFCTTRGWQRPLVRAWEHVGCKAAHVGALSKRALASFGDLGTGVLAVRRRHRLAVLEELLRARRGDAAQLLRELDEMDRALDRDGLGESFWLATIDASARASWPLRALARFADRVGVPPGTPAQEVGSLVASLQPWLSDGDTLSESLAGTLLASDRSVTQSLAIVHDAPSGAPSRWAARRLLEMYERAFGSSSFPECVIAARTLGLVHHPRFEGDPERLLRQLVATLREGSPSVRQELVANVHRGPTAPRATWVRLADRAVPSLEELCRQSNAQLWELEDLDLWTFDHPLRGRIATQIAGLERLGARMGGDDAPALGPLLDRWRSLARACADRTDLVPPAERDRRALDGLEADADRLERETEVAIEAGRQARADAHIEAPDNCIPLHRTGRRR